MRWRLLMVSVPAPTFVLPLTLIRAPPPGGVVRDCPVGVSHSWASCLGDPSSPESPPCN